LKTENVVVVVVAAAGVVVVVVHIIILPVILYGCECGLFEEGA